MQKNASARRYLQRFRRAFPISRKEFDRTTASFQERLNDFTTERPHAALAELCAAFGEPEEVAAEFLTSFDQKELAEMLAQARSIRRVKAWGIALIVILLAIIAAIVSIHLAEVISFNNGYYIETIVEGSAPPSYSDAIEVY